MQAKGDSDSVLIVGAGPAGLEAARALGLRGYQVAIAEAGAELGGRVARECRLPGLSAWARVRDYRQYQLSQMANVDIYFERRLSADEILAFGFQNIAIATGSTWRRDGVARACRADADGSGHAGLHAGRFDGRQRADWHHCAVRRRPLPHGRRSGRADGIDRAHGLVLSFPAAYARASRRSNENPREGVRRCETKRNKGRATFSCNNRCVSFVKALKAQRRFPKRSDNAVRSQ